MARRGRRKGDVVRSFRARARRNELTGSDFVELAMVGDSTLCPYLRELKALNKWPDHFDGRHFEGPWVTVLCTWFEKGTAGLIRLGREGGSIADFVGMCLTVLGTTRSAERLAEMAQVIPLHFSLPTHADAFETPSSWCVEIVRMLAGGGQLGMSDATQRHLRRFAHLLLAKATRRIERGGLGLYPPEQTAAATELFYFQPGLALLKHVGDHSSIELLQRLPLRAADAEQDRREVVETILARMSVQRPQ